MKDKFIAEKPKQRNPKLVIYGVDVNITEDNLIENIVESNRDVEEYIKDNNLKIEDEMAVRFKFRRNNNKTNATTNMTTNATTNATTNQNPNKETTNTWVIEVSPQLRRLMISRRTVKIEWRSLRFADYLPVIRCHKCNSFGHIQKDCTAAQACGHCGQDHDSRVCPTPKAQHKCINCFKSNQTNKMGRQLNVKHSSFSDNCDVYKRIVSIIKSKISYV